MTSQIGMWLRSCVKNEYVIEKVWDCESLVRIMCKCNIMSVMHLKTIKELRITWNEECLSSVNEHM